MGLRPAGHGAGDRHPRRHHAPGDGELQRVRNRHGGRRLPDRLLRDHRRPGLLHLRPEAPDRGAVARPDPRSRGRAAAQRRGSGGLQRAPRANGRGRRHLQARRAPDEPHLPLRRRRDGHRQAPRRLPAVGRRRRRHAPDAGGDGPEDRKDGRSPVRLRPRHPPHEGHQPGRRRLRRDAPGRRDAHPPDKAPGDARHGEDGILGCAGGEGHARPAAAEAPGRLGGSPHYKSEDERPQRGVRLRRHAEA
mmetsp:Transcript_38524/g.101878  ORF Transcript_38524/g.101878 Transcript_38524/m.101878 type:complete len:248 (-) Transcript_38524:384-1127(-)